ncbi:AAA family ATPase [Stappia sp. F7233]|uniref:AAA family ATPase n=1 Tax=Stappia albiluteola TaxID=2758565 RepID=A0A839AAL2_9HYPH|nr:AAA family ATPase [Stappia albiluteola]MBA5776700.1 AAA family ATPase [Stappia albiluteola]
MSFGERREVTALFYDLIDSTKLLTHSDLEEFQDVIAAFHEKTSRAVQSQGGSIGETFGDGGMAFFGHPEPLEDTATAAIQAGLDIVQACRRLAAEAGRDDLHVRIGIATSEVVVQLGEAKIGAGVTGLAPTLASRLQGLAEPDTVVVGERTRELARRHFSYTYLGAHKLKGLDEELNLWSVKPRAIRASRFLASGRLSTHLVGRKRELETALGLWKKAASGQGQTLVLTGEAGIGKSRFAYEVFRRTRAGRSRLTVLQCDPRSSNISMFPLAELVRASSGLGEDIGAHGLGAVADLMQGEGISDPEVIETIAFAAGVAPAPNGLAAEVNPQRVRDRIVWAIHEVLAAWAQAGPVIIAVEDLHWIDPTSLDLLKDLTDWIADKPILLVLTMRDAQGWLESRKDVTHIALNRLQADEIGDFVAKLIPGDDQDGGREAALPLIYQRTNGIPLFLEELLQWLKNEPGNGDVDTLTKLSNARIFSFENLLSARLGASRLAKSVAQAASVIGHAFDEETLWSILPDVAANDITHALDDLVEAKLLVRRRDGSGGTYDFRHAMIEETLYGTLLRKSRSALHEKIYLAASAGTARTKLGPARLAEHAERAGLSKEAVRNFIAAAKESSIRSAVVEARHFLERASRLLEAINPDDEREKLELTALAALGPILTSTQGTRSPEACRLYERAVEIARRRPIHEQAQWFPIYWGWWYTGADFGIQRERAETVMSDLRQVADPEVQLQVQHCVWAIDFNMGRHDTCVAAVDAGLELYQAGRGRESLTLYGGHDPRVCGLGQKGLSLWFKGFPSRALASVEESLRWAREIRHMGSECHACDIAAMLHRYRRDYGSLREVIGNMRELARKHDLPSLDAKSMIFEGWCMAELGDPAAGGTAAEEGAAILAGIGTREDFPVYSEMRAEILAMQGETAAALSLLNEALAEAEATGHRYWLAELYRRRALVLDQRGEGKTEVVDALNRALAVAQDQGAKLLFLMAYHTALELGVADEIEPEFHQQALAAAKTVEQSTEMAALLASIAAKAGAAFPG